MNTPQPISLADANRALAALAVLIFAAAGTARAQTCPYSGDPGSQQSTLSLKAASGACTADDGGYVKYNVQYKLHIAASTTGGCQTRILQCSPLPCICVNGTYYPRTLGVSYLYDSTQPSYIGAVQPLNSSIQQYDTGIPTGTLSTGISLWPAAEGSRMFTSTTSVSTTPCNLTPTTFPNSLPLTANVLKCEPIFYMTGEMIKRLAPAAPDNVEVYLPSAMSGASPALQAAVDDWNGSLTGTGVQFEVTSTACTSGPKCITVTTGTIQSCGLAQSNSDPDTGEITDGAVLTLNESWNTVPFSGQGLQRTFVHELGHFLGCSTIARARSSTDVPDSTYSVRTRCFDTGCHLLGARRAGRKSRRSYHPRQSGASRQVPGS